MRDKERITRIMMRLSYLWHRNPDQRFGQLLENYIFGCQRQLVSPEERIDFDKKQIYYPKVVGECIFHIEDDIIEERIKELVKLPNEK